MDMDKVFNYIEKPEMLEKMRNAAKQLVSQIQDVSLKIRDLEKRLKVQESELNSLFDNIKKLEDNKISIFELPDYK